MPVPIATRAGDAFRLTPEQLKAAITPRTKLLILPFPNNPTGAVMRRAHLEAIAGVLRGTGIMVLSDEIYAELTYGDERHISFAEIDGMKERTILVQGFSKSYAMTGWRLGYAAGPAPVIKQMTKIHQFSIMCAPTTSQYAAVEALRNGDADIEEMRGQYDMRRRLLVDGLNRMGLDCFSPEGAFYVFPSIRSTGSFQQRILYASAGGGARRRRSGRCVRRKAAKGLCAFPIPIPSTICSKPLSGSTAFSRRFKRSAAVNAPCFYPSSKPCTFRRTYMPLDGVFLTRLRRELAGAVVGGASTRFISRP